MRSDDAEVGAMGHGTGPAAAGGATAWVRRCAVCGDDDLRSAFGRAVVPDDASWSCPRCGSSRWRPQPLAWPGSGGAARCPFLAGRPPTG